jgi:asparagine synthase (glutamine-hydrolysing)
MCGIAGLVSNRRTLDIVSAIRSMTCLVSHRGPDDEGYFVNGRVALGHRRLSVIDLSPSGHQPMASLDGRYVITYNGEIYNYIELREQLRSLGHPFRSNSDTEVILAAYAQWGQDCLEKFNGMWAFAIYDTVAQTLFAARDRFGVKPFYYVRFETGLAFGSETRQLLQFLPNIMANEKIVYEFLFTSMQDHTDATFFDGIYKLPAGHCFTYDTGIDKLELSRYYFLAKRVNEFGDFSEIERVEKFRETFEDAVRMRLRSDVIVGSCLSGGLDSSSIASTAARLLRDTSDRMFSAITAVSEDPAGSEEKHAATVVRKARLNWVRVRPSYHDFVGTVRQTVLQQEEPFASPSILMQAHVMRSARENGITVLLDGQGGDETLLGYPRYYPAYYLSMLREKGVQGLFSAILQSTRNGPGMSRGRWLNYLLWSVSPKLRWWYYGRRMRNFGPSANMPDWLGATSEASGDITALQILDIEKTGLPQLLRFEDKNSMAFAVETRLPFLDYRLVEQSVSMPLSLKMRDGWSKWVLRHVMQDTLPGEIAWRRDKIGFDAPEQIWLRKYRDTMIKSVAGSSLLRKLIDVPTLMKTYAVLDLRTQWRLFSVAQWEDCFGIGA